MPKVSVVVPVYNVQDYLSKCLDSVLVQTLEDIEIICIDDGSTDESGIILDVYAEKDARIKVVHKENSGYGDSMNIGFDMAIGEYIGIVESDDMIKPNMYEVLYQTAKEYQLDVVKSNAIFWWESIDYQETSYKKHLNDVYDKVLTPENRAVMLQFLMNIWTGIYRRDFLREHHIRYNTTSGASYQDNGFWLQTLCFAERVMCLKDAFYYYRQDNPLASVKSHGKVYAMLNEYKYVEEILKGRVGDTERNLCTYYRLFRHRGNFLRIEDIFKRDFADVIIEDYKKYGTCLKDNPRLAQWMVELCDNPDEFCADIIQKKEEILEKLQKADKIVLYGAGNRARAVIKRLYNIELYNKISEVVVTERNGKEKLANLSICDLDNYTEHSSNTLFVIAVSENTEGYEEIIATLKKRGIYNVLETKDLVQFFYSVC